MGVMPVNKLIINMSLPMMISMLVQALYNIVDSVFVGMISEQALTAVSLCFPAQNLMIAVATGTGVGINALLSRSLGERNFEKANKLANNGVFLAVISSMVFVLFGLFGAEPFMRSQTGVEEIIQYGTNYLRVCSCASLGIYLEITFERLLQTTGRTMLTMITQGVGAIINIILDPIFIFSSEDSFLGFGLGMDVTGAAVATVTGQVVAAILTFVVLFVLYLLEMIIGNVKDETAKTVLSWFSVFGRYDDFKSGIFNVSSIIYYISFVFVALFLTARNIERRRYS